MTIEGSKKGKDYASLGHKKMLQELAGLSPEEAIEKVREFNAERVKNYSNKNVRDLIDDSDHHL